MDLELNGIVIIVGAYGTPYGFYVDGNRVKFGPIESGYLQGLDVLARWYKDGLLDPDFTTIDGTGFKSKMTSGEAGACIGSIGDTLYGLNDAMADHPPFRVVPTLWPALNKGGVPQIAQKSYPFDLNGAFVVTQQARDVKTALRWLN